MRSLTTPSWLSIVLGKPPQVNEGNTQDSFVKVRREAVVRQYRFEQAC
jgi:hypothetical protein